MNIQHIYKLLLTRKFSNHLLENLFDRNNKINYMKTEHRFEDSSNENFPIIIDEGDINKIPKNNSNN